jgi:hypothetical protein
MKTLSFLFVLLGFGGFAVAQTAAQTSTASAPKVVVGKQLTAKATTPAPGKTAKNAAQRASVGKGATAVKASQPSSFWVEDLDVDDDGVVESSDYLYDAQRGLLYTYREDDFACPNGKPESGSILMALYAKGNKGHKPVGSGWYLVNLNAGQCATKKAGTFGCRFDASGYTTACGAATINEATGEIDVVAVQQE